MVALLVVTLAMLSGAAVRAAPHRNALPLANSDFERVVRPAPTAYGCCFADWLFAVRAGDYGLTAHEREGDSTCARITSHGTACRADLTLPPSAWSRSPNCASAPACCGGA